MTITRRLERGRIPLAGAHDDSSGQFSVAEVELGGLMRASDPLQNIEVRSRDVITVPRAELIYVVGQVRRPGGFVLHDRETLSVLEALSLAEGLARTAAPQKAKILRAMPNAAQRSEIPCESKGGSCGQGPRRLPQTLRHLVRSQQHRQKRGTENSRRRRSNWDRHRYIPPLTALVS